MRNVFKSSDIVFTENVYSINSETISGFGGSQTLGKAAPSDETIVVKKEAAPIRNVEESEARLTFLLEREKRNMERDFLIQSEFQKRTAFNEGYLAGLTELEEKLGAFKQPYNQIINDIKADIDRRLAEIERNVVMISSEIFEKILDRQLANDHSFVLDLVKKALDEVKTADWISLTVSNRSKQLAEELKSTLAELGMDTKVDVTTVDADLGTCIVETRDGTIDASVETQLENIRQLLI